MNQVVVIGSGFAGLAAACRLAKDGFAVTLLEKNSQLGGRARTWVEGGFTFDMGPSWYWMPDVFEEFFGQFGKHPSDYYNLVRLDPSYRVFLPGTDRVDVPAGRDALETLFEQRERGSAARLRAFLDEAAQTYRIGMGEFVRKPSLSLSEFMDPRLLTLAPKLGMFTSMRDRVARVVSDDALRQILEFPVLFLGGTAKQIPAMYSLMNHADLVQGTWYPMGGMRLVADAMIALARELGVELLPSTEARSIRVENGRAVAVVTDQGELRTDWVVGAGDYHHVEQQLLPAEHRVYTEPWWDKQVLSPSSLLVFLGINRRLDGLLHHNLFFDEGLDAHAEVIYDRPAWPAKPLFYACAPSRTDPSVAPEGCENLFLLVPLAPGLSDTDTARETIIETVMDRLEARIGVPVRRHVVVRRTYAHKDFLEDYHAYKGNAYGLANTLRQTAIFKPKMRSSKVRNLFYAGQLTVPGPGVPPSLLSGGMVAGLIAGEASRKR